MSLTQENILIRLKNYAKVDVSSFLVDGECGMELILKEETMSVTVHTLAKSSK